MNEEQKAAEDGGLVKTVCISYPRSGHHLLTNLLLKYFSKDMSMGSKASRPDLSQPVVAGKLVYCEFYQHCNQTPCTDERVNYMKNHDRPPQLDPDSLDNVVVQYRHPLASLLSFFELRKGRMPESAKEFKRFLDKMGPEVMAFFNKWVVNKRAGTLLVPYEQLVSNPSSLLAAVVRHLDPAHEPDAELIEAVVKAQGIFNSDKLDKFMPMLGELFREWEDAHPELFEGYGIARLVKDAPAKKTAAPKPKGGWQRLVGA